MKKLNITNTNDKVLTIGFFDGIHLGHLKIINKLFEYNYEKVIFTFDDSLLKLFKNQEVITPYNQKIKLLEKFNFDYYLNLDSNLLKLSAKEFIDFLNSINVKVIICGEDFKFGNDFKDYEYLKDNSNIEVIIVKDYYVNNKKLSSSLIREMIKNNQIEIANTYLYHNFMIEGTCIYNNNNYILSNPSINISLLDNNKHIASFNNKEFEIYKEDNYLIICEDLNNYINKKIIIDILK